MTTLLRVKDLHTGYNIRDGAGLSVGRNINFAMSHSELICLLGPNGSGKSTLIRSIAGLQPVFAGQVFLHERSINSYQPRELARILGVVLTEGIEDPYLTVTDLLTFARYSYMDWRGQPGARDLEIINEMMELTGTSRFKERRLCDLSDGERQKIMITRALVQESDLILLDEPTSFLDMPHKLEIFQLLRRLSQEEGRSFLLSTHDLALAISEADRLLILTPDGLIDGCPEQLILNGMIEQIFCRDGILFDAFTAEFKPVRKFRDSIVLKGDGLGFVWTKKALIRELWQVFADEKNVSSGLSVDAALKIEVHKEEDNYFWKLHTNKEECLFSDLGELLTKLRKYNSL